MKTIEPFISIITVVYNAVDTIEKTIRSVVSQPYVQFEYIIIDGGSTDGTLDIILRYKDKIACYVSETDGGIYYAMNKGIAKSKGKYVYFINAGDICYSIPGIELKNHEGDLVCFPVESSNGDILYPEINNTIKIKNTLPHQGCFYKNTYNLKYNTSYKIFADFALNQTYFQLNLKIIVMNAPVVAYHDTGGISHDKKYGNEVFKVVKDNFGLISLLRSYLYFKFNGVKYRFKKIKK